MTDNQKEIIRLNDLVSKLRRENFELSQEIKELNKSEFVPEPCILPEYMTLGEWFHQL